MRKASGLGYEVMLIVICLEVWLIDNTLAEASFTPIARFIYRLCDSLADVDQPAP